VLYCLTLNFAPPFGVVVLIQTLPLGAGVVSPDLNAGTAVCGAASNLGELDVPAVRPKSVNKSPVPAASKILPSATEPFDSLNEFANNSIEPSTSADVTPATPAALIIVTKSAIPVPLANTTFVPLILIESL
jgi:hypothetical protein